MPPSVREFLEICMSPMSVILCSQSVSVYMYVFTEACVKASVCVSVCSQRLVHALRSADMGVAPASSPGDEPFCPPLMAGSFGTPVTRPHLSVMK